MKLTKPIIFFISFVAILLAFFIAPKPPIIQSLDAQYNRYESLNTWLGFHYPKAWGDFQTQFPTVFESEDIKFSNGVNINLGRHEGEFTGEVLSEKIIGKAGHSCTLYIGKAGFAPDEYMTSAVCYHNDSSKQVLATVYNVFGLERAQEYFEQFRTLVKSI